MKQHMILIWTGRISGVLVTAFFAVFLLGKGMPEILNATGTDLLHFLPYTLLTFTGFLLTWYSPLWGGRLLLAGAMLLAGYFLYHQEIAIGLIFAIPSLLIGLCFLAAANKELI